MQIINYSNFSESSLETLLSCCVDISSLRKTSYASVCFLPSSWSCICSSSVRYYPLTFFIMTGFVSWKEAALSMRSTKLIWFARAAADLFCLILFYALIAVVGCWWVIVYFEVVYCSKNSTYLSLRLLRFCGSSWLSIRSVTAPRA